MTFFQTLTKLRSGQVDLIAYVTSFCDRIEAEEPKIQAIVPGTFDRQRILRSAAKLLESYPDIEKRPALFGLPVGVKDIFRVDRFPTRCGSALPGHLFDGPEADCVQRLKRAGVIIMAKTVTTEFAFNEPGPTRNPYDPGRTPGGSSSGSAAGVASGFFPLALGSQTVGSVIRPAAFCGVVGFKPSSGRISLDGVIPYSATADHVGVFCQDSSGLGTLLKVMSDGWQPTNVQKPLKDIVFGVPEGPYFNRTAPNGRAFFNQQIERLTDAGYRIKPVQAFSDFKTIESDHTNLIAGEMARYHAPWFKAQRHLYRPRTLAQIEKGLSIRDEALEALRVKVRALRKTVEAQMTAASIDFWICPPATDHAPQGLDSTGDAVMNLPWTSSGLPAVTLPAGLDAIGMPQGVQVVARFMEDGRLIPVADEMFKILANGR